MVLLVDTVTNLRITDSEALPSPADLCGDIARTPQQKMLVAKSRNEMHSLIHGEDKRLLAVVGPCSIHDLKACREYAERFAKLAEELRDRLLMVMRVYFEKPRTTVGWKGLIMDPKLNGTCDIPEGLRIARSFLGEVLDLGIPTATELLDPITPQYLADSLCWAAIGAADFRVSDSSPNGIRTLHAGGFQECNRRGFVGCGQRNCGRHHEPNLSGDHRGRAGIRRHDRRKPGLPAYPARRFRRSELRIRTRCLRPGSS